MKYLFILSLVFLFSAARAQQVTISILPTLNSLPIEPEKPVVIGNDTIVIEKLQFYLSNISVSDSKQTFSFAESAKLIVAGTDNRFKILTSESFVPSELSFVFGTDSIMNCSGIMGGDLDPALGMYWAWQSGYINFKLEGRSSGFGKNNSFQFHLGGYKHPLDTARKVTLSAETTEIVIELPVDAMLAEVKNADSPTVMRPCKKGSELCTFIAGNFRPK